MSANGATVQTNHKKWSRGQRRHPRAHVSERAGVNSVARPRPLSRIGQMSHQRAWGQCISVLRLTHSYHCAITCAMGFDPPRLCVQVKSSDVVLSPSERREAAVRVRNVSHQRAISVLLRLADGCDNEECPSARSVRASRSTEANGPSPPRRATAPGVGKSCHC
jgi:hypothetical protein